MEKIKNEMSGIVNNIGVYTFKKSMKLVNMHIMANYIFKPTQSVNSAMGYYAFKECVLLNGIKIPYYGFIDEYPIFRDCTDI